MTLHILEYILSFQHIHKPCSLCFEPNVPQIMGLHGAKEGDNRGCKGGWVKHGDHKIMDPNQLRPNGVHSGPMGLLEAPLDAIYASTI